MALNGGMKRQFESVDDFESSKRLRSQTASRVIFVCGLPSDCLESELLALCCPFAVVEKCLLISQKRQAFVQLPDVVSASNLVTFYQTHDAQIRSKKIFFEYSNRDEIKVQLDHDASPSYQQQQQALGDRQYQQLPPMQFAPQHDISLLAGDGGQFSMIQHDGPRRGVGQPNQILMVSVSNIEYDVTVDVLQQVFQKFGNVQKIVTFWKDNEFKALVQMESIDQAQAAQSALDGRDIYTGCNQLSIVFSRHPELRVRYNDDRSRDYTNPNLPPGPSRGESQTESEPMLTASSEQRDEFRDIRYNNSPVRNGELDYRGPVNALSVGSRDPNVRDNRIGAPRFDERPPQMDRPRDARSGRELPIHSTGRAIRGDTRPSPALICSNIDSELVSPHRLFTLFGCFGDVLRIKIMFRKRDTALIQFVNEVHSTSALDHLDGVYVFGKKLRVDYSKHSSVSMPHADADRFEVENTLDFSGSPLHRYRRRSPEEAVSPCPLLHISGIPMELQRNQNALVDHFSQFGFVKNFHFLQNNPKMALVEMGSIDEAIMALLRLDNLGYPESHMRISFSKAYQFPGGNGPGPGPALGPPHGSGAGPGSWNALMPLRPRDRSRDRSRNRERGTCPTGDRDRSFRDRAPPQQRGHDFQPRDHSRRPPPRF
ncbi:polypyrimidine tract-binding [Plasmopara halstedii]|uniref:Polypyrimidine tract-binding n=1 Tax=Plasmopara halstedii TaxID=4781 RepID=A0A0P1B1M3_PLAHL|nr:polypyrimidine tract-binding [Plasmopara halstedii]CEG47458.1 polypyrimidine tract-binding [Plasmopara halstedii]|eukprot:XP_024583827.1 polypyrimidine tract-binding [Plasmopara halstedii]